MASLIVLAAEKFLPFVIEFKQKLNCSLCNLGTTLERAFKFAFSTEPADLLMETQSK